jgi:hypothetical protein
MPGPLPAAVLLLGLIVRFAAADPVGVTVLGQAVRPYSRGSVAPQADGATTRAIPASLRRHLAALSGTAQTTPASGPGPQGAITETAGRDASGVRTATGQSTSTGALTPGTGPASKAAQQALKDEQEQVLPFLVNTAADATTSTGPPEGAFGACSSRRRAKSSV